MMDLDPVKIEYADGKLKGLLFIVDKVESISDRIIEIDRELDGMVQSPHIKSRAQAFYLQSPPVYRNNLIALQDEQDRLKDEYRQYADQMNQIARYLQRLSTHEVRLLSLRYELGKTYVSIARILHTNKDSVARELQEILNKY